MLRTKPDVFIIESLDPDDEGNGRFEGSIISNMLRLHGKEPKYRYVRTRGEFEDAVGEFGRSRYRYPYRPTAIPRECAPLTRSRSTTTNWLLC